MTVAKVWDGTQWVAIVGAQGPQGVKGDQGIQGIPGGTMGAAGYHSTANGATISIANTWKTLPLAANPTIDPTGVFVQNVDNSITIVEAGWYTVQAFAVFNTAGISGAVGLSTVTDSGPNIGSPGAGVAGVAWGPNSVLVDSFKVAAGTKIYAVAVTSSSTGIVSFLTNLSIVRVGGPQGQMEIYEQPNEPPTTAKTGAIWVDTDEAPSTGGNLPAGGTTGQTLTKTSSTDFAANWQTPAAPPAISGKTYTMSGYAADRVLNAGASSMNEIAAVLATLIDDMKAAGLIK